MPHPHLCHSCLRAFTCVCSMDVYLVPDCPECAEHPWKVDLKIMLLALEGEVELHPLMMCTECEYIRALQYTYQQERLATLQSQL